MTIFDRVKLAPGMLGDRARRNSHELGYGFRLNDLGKSQGILRVAEDSRLSRLLIV
jgi:hypothetical protein